MLHVKEEDVDKLTEAISHIIEGRTPGQLEIPFDATVNEFTQLTCYLNVLIFEYNELAKFVFAISRGDLDYEAPQSGMQVLHSIKNLHANLRHLAWKTQQIARGDFSQRIDFLGEFSRSFNSMAEQLADARAELLRKNEELDAVSRMDPLTGLLNRRGAGELLDKELHRSNRSGRPFVILLADIDHFKRVNDTHGHAAGDAVLIEVARSLLAEVRGEDVCARWGGEEFLVLLTETELLPALAVGERLRCATEEARALFNGQRIPVTLSVGMSAYHPGEALESCIARADACLYNAKQAGRNQIWFQEAPDTSAQPALPVPRQQACEESTVPA